MNKKMPLVLLAVLAAFVAGTMLSYPIASSGITANDLVGFKGGVICACKNSAECHEGMPGANCNHNVLTNFGKNATRLYLSVDGTREAFDVLALSNGSAPTADSYNFTTELTSGIGLGRSAGTVTNNPTTGNWSIVKTWTASGSAYSVNTTGIFNDTAAGMGPMLAGGTFTSVNLEANDQLTINYTLWIS